LGQKCNPIGLRLGINRTWNSIWFDQKDFSGKLMEDLRNQKVCEHQTERGRCIRSEDRKET